MRGEVAAPTGRGAKDRSRMDQDEVGASFTTYFTISLLPLYTFTSRSFLFTSSPLNHVFETPG